MSQRAAVSQQNESEHQPEQILMAGQTSEPKARVRWRQAEADLGPSMLQWTERTREAGLELMLAQQHTMTPGQRETGYLSTCLMVPNGWDLHRSESGWSKTSSEPRPP